MIIYPIKLCLIHSFSYLAKYSYPKSVSVILADFVRWVRILILNVAILCPSCLRSLHCSTFSLLPALQMYTSYKSSIFWKFNFVGNPNFLNSVSMECPKFSKADVPFAKNTSWVAMWPAWAKSSILCSLKAASNSLGASFEYVKHT